MQCRLTTAPKLLVAAVSATRVVLVQSLVHGYTPTLSAPRCYSLISPRTCRQMLTKVLLLGILQCCYSAPTASGRPDGGQCGRSKCLPGIDKLGAGFDIFTGTSDGLQQIFDFSYNSGNTYVNPFNSSLSYAQPDNVTVRDKTSSMIGQDSGTYYTAKSFAHSLAVSVSVSGEGAVFGASFEASASAKYVNSLLTSSSAYGSFASYSEIKTIYEVVLPDAANARASPAFQAAWKRLPPNYNTSTAPLFQDFLSYFGTHYTHSAVFGGMGKMSCAVNSEFSKQQSSSRTSAEAETHFQFLKAAASAGHSRNDSSTSFLSGSHFSTSMIGGDPSLGDLTDWPSWTKTFYNAPAVVSYKVRDITDMIWDPASASAIRRAIEDKAGGPWIDNCTNASVTIANLERRLTSGSSSWRHAGWAVDFTSGFSVATSSSALMSIQAVLKPNLKDDVDSCFIKVYDTSSTPSPRDGPVKLLYNLDTRSMLRPFDGVSQFSLLPGQLNIVYPGNMGLAMGRGIGVRATKGFYDDDNEACGGDLSVTIMYK